MFSVKIRGVRVCADIGFLAVISLISLSGKSICGFSFLACILHELGHLAAICACGNSVRKISFDAFGIKIIPGENNINSVKADIMILLSGPMMNFISALIVYIINKRVCSSFVTVSLIIGTFNLFPFPVLDGGSIITHLSEYFLSEEKSDVFKKIWSVINILIVMSMLYIYFSCKFKNISFILMSVWLLVSEVCSSHKKNIEKKSYQNID